jgi:hypothetical protein
MRPAIAAVFLLLVLAANPPRQVTPVPTPKQCAGHANSSGVHSEAAIGEPCLFDFELGEVPNCIRQSPTGKLSIAPQYLTQLSFDSHGLAAVLSPKERWMYVDHTGKVVISGVPVMDNGADTFHDGLVRIVKTGKYGFANRRGQAVIPPIYDGALNFEKGRATVCKGCKSKCAGAGWEYHSFAGGEWFQIDTKGTILGRLRPNG